MTRRPTSDPMPSTRLGVLVLLAAAPLLASLGCRSVPARHFVLTSLADADAPGIVAEEGDELAVGVGPIELPRYLDRPQLVSGLGANERRLSDYARWAEPLADGFTRVLAENLAVLLPTQRVLRHPGTRSMPMDVRVSVDVLRFEASRDDECLLAARWTLWKESPAGSVRLLTRRDQLVQPALGGDDQARVEAMSRCVSELSRLIALEIQAGR